MLYPFPDRAIGACLGKYVKARQIVWIQEEPRNAGAWAYMRELFSLHFPLIDLEYMGCSESASSATGSFKQYRQEQKQLIEGAFEPFDTPSTMQPEIEQTGEV